MVNFIDMEQIPGALASLQVQMDRLAGTSLMPLHKKLIQAFVSEARNFTGIARTLVVQMTAEPGATEAGIDPQRTNDAPQYASDLAIYAQGHDHAAELSQVEGKLRDALTQLRTAEFRARGLERSYQTLHSNSSQEIAALRSRLADADHRFASLGSANEELAAQWQPRPELGRINSALATVTLKNSSAQRVIEVANEKEARLQRQFEEATEGMAVAKRERDEFRSQCQAANAELDAVKAEHSRSQERLEEALEGMAAAERERDQFKRDLQRHVDDAVRQRDDAIAAREDVERRLSAAEEQLAEQAEEARVLNAKVTNLGNELAMYDDGSRVRRSMILKRKREVETPIDKVWRHRAKMVHDIMLDLHPDSNFKVTHPEIIHAADRMVAVLGGRDGRYDAEGYLRNLFRNATRDVWFCFDAATTVGWEAAAGVPEPCPQHGASCFQICNTGNGLGFRLLQGNS